MRSSSNFSFAPLLLLLALGSVALLLGSPLTVVVVEGCGMPSGGGGGGGMCCCCPSGGGVSGGFGGAGGCVGRRRRREIATSNYLRDGERMPCPMSHWQLLMEQAIEEGGDVVGSIRAVQKTLNERFPSNRFMVLCGDNPVLNHATSRLQHTVHFTSTGDSYCSVFNQRVWCQAAALFA